MARERAVSGHGLRASLTILSAASGLGVAAWLVPASVQIASWQRAGIGRIAVFAPLYVLWMALAASAIVAALLWFAGSTDLRPRRAFIVGPLNALWIWTVPFLPWLADRMPLLLILAGSSRPGPPERSPAGTEDRLCRVSRAVHRRGISFSGGRRAWRR
jgi:hypothetical protein